MNAVIQPIHAMQTQHATIQKDHTSANVLMVITEMEQIAPVRISLIHRISF